jgi:hypothetical protein
LNGATVLPEKLCDRGAAHPATNEKNAMQPVVVTGFLGSQNFILNREPHNSGILNLGLAHGSLPPFGSYDSTK